MFIYYLFLYSFMADEKETWNKLRAEVELILNNFKLELAAKTHQHLSYGYPAQSRISLVGRVVFAKGIFKGIFFKESIGSIFVVAEGDYVYPTKFKVEVILVDKSIENEFRLQVEEFEKVLIDDGIMQKGNLTKKGF